MDLFVMREVLLILVLLLSVGCTSPSISTEQARVLFPFADRPTEEVTFQHDIQVVVGSVFHFQQDGSRTIYHLLPVSTIVDSNTYVISVSSRLNITDFMSTSFDAEEDVLAIMNAAETYCDQTGYRRVDKGISIWVGNTKSALVEFCVPEGIQLPPSYKAGDRVPRN